MNNFKKIGGNSVLELLSDYILKPAASGLYGFAAFFLIIVISKFLGSLIGTVKGFQVDISDISLSFLGFFFIFLITLLKNIQKNHPQS